MSLLENTPISMGSGPPSAVLELELGVKRGCAVALKFELLQYITTNNFVCWYVAKTPICLHKQRCIAPFVFVG